MYLLVQRFGQKALLSQAHELDAGFDQVVLAAMIRTIDRLDDDELPLAVEDVPPARAFFRQWASELD